MLKIEFSGQFKRDYKLSIKRGHSQQRLIDVVSMLQKQVPLPEKYHDHALANSRDFKDARECHIEPDWLLVYQIKEDVLTLRLLRTGSHSDLFR